MPTSSDVRIEPAGASVVERFGTRLLWGLLLDPPMDGARNMARDHALALSVAEGEAALRIYRWSRPTISLGRNEPALGRYDALPGGFDVVRRPTGGRAVLHDRELTYAVALPAGALGGPRRVYAALNRALVRALRSLGVDAGLAPEGPALLPDAGPCFRHAAPGEVSLAGRKLVGSAQVRIGRSLLQHGSLLLEPGQERLDQAGAAGVDEAARPTSLVEILGHVPPWELCAEAVAAGVAAELGGAAGPTAYGPVTLDPSAQERLTQRYRSHEWTWRR